MAITPASPILPTSLAAIVGAGAQNVAFGPSVSNKERKIVIIGTYDPAKTGVTAEVAEFINSAADAADKYGFGSMIHRLALSAYAGSQGLQTWVVPQAEAGGAVAASGTLTVTGPSTEAGTVYLYIGGDLVKVAVASGDTDATIAASIETAVNADTSLPVTASAALGVVTITAKTKGTWGNKIALTFNWGFQETLPAGVSIVVVDMASGATDPDITDALTNGLGNGDNANEKDFTALVHGYGYVTAQLNALSTYNGSGNLFEGCYQRTVARPMRSLTGDTAAGSAGLSTLIALGDGRKTDRTNGVIAVPGSPSHPEEIAALAMGTMELINGTRAEESYVGRTLSGVIPGAMADRWTVQYTDRDTAVKAGVSPTLAKDGGVVMQNVVSFYHPDSVPDDSNGYRSMRNISIIQNQLNSVKVAFDREKWQGISIVNDTSLVTNSIDRAKARDVSAVTDELFALVDGFEGKAWIFQGAWSKAKIAASPPTIRAGGTGFDCTLPVVLSGEGGILDTIVQFDTNVAVITGS
jgi:phage tail sheath gpL-like